MSAFFRSCTCQVPTGPLGVQSLLQQLGFALLKDTRFSPCKRFRLETVLSFDLSTLRQFAGLDEDASFYDIISYIVTEYCPELTGLTTMFHATTNEVSVIYQNELAPTADPETEDRIFHNSAEPHYVQSCLQEIGSELLEDTHFSSRNRSRLETVLSFDFPTLHQFAGLDKAASLYDILDYLVQEYCDELIGLNLSYFPTINKIQMYFMHKAAPIHSDKPNFMEVTLANDFTLPERTDNLYSTPWELRDNTVALGNTTNLIQMTPSTTTASSSDDYSDDDDIFEHQQRKDASDVGILTNPSPTSAQRIDASESNSLTLNRLKHHENDEFHIYDNTTTNMKLMPSENLEEDHMTKNDENHTKLNPSNNVADPKRNNVSVLHDTEMSPSSLIIALDGSTFNVNINVHHDLTMHDTENDTPSVSPNDTPSVTSSNTPSHSVTVHDTTEYDTPSISPGDTHSVPPSNTHSVPPKDSDTPSHDVTLHDTEYDTPSISPSDTPTVSPSDMPSVSPSSEASLYNYWENDSGDRYYSAVQDVYLDEYPSESDYDDDDDENYYYSGSSVEI